MTAYKFDPAKLEKLNDPGRLVDLDPGVMWERAGVPDARMVVEIGAGTGMFAAQFARRMRGGTLYAVDVSDQMLEWMRGHLPEDVRTRVVPLKSSETRVPLPGCSADLVYMINVHHELERPEEILREANRLLKPAGTLLVVDWKKTETPKGPPVDHRVSEEDIVAQTTAAGFSAVRSHDDALPYHSVVTAKKA